eukprot:1224972-Rhodomonas_salina.1
MPAPWVGPTLEFMERLLTCRVASRQRCRGSSRQRIRSWRRASEETGACGGPRPYAPPAASACAVPAPRVTARGKLAGGGHGRVWRL